MRTNIILAKAKLMKLVFMDLWISDLGFYRMELIVGCDFVRATKKCLWDFRAMAIAALDR